MTNAMNNYRRIRVKLCGITRIEDAAFAVKQGVDALGFIFAEKSPRNIAVRDASKIIKTIPPFVDRVGVFVDASTERIKRCADAGLSYLQLHGNESSQFCEQLRTELPYCKIFKAFRIGPASSAEEFSSYHDSVDGFLLDTYVKGESGGTGKVFDWSILKRLQLAKPFLLAGGLSPDNVSNAMEIVRPYGLYALDINSGVEVSPGIKDHSKLEKLMDVVRSLEP